MAITLLLLLGSVTCDVAGQVCFKLGVGHHAAPQARGIAGLLRRLGGSRWVALGVLIYAVEFVLWFSALSRAPLSFAFPIAAFSYVGVVMASRFVLREQISTRGWLGAAAIVIGVALVCGPQLA